MESILTYETINKSYSRPIFQKKLDRKTETL
jgi:hypothetical protein